MATDTPLATAPATRASQARATLELPWTRWLYRSRRSSVLWLIVRLWLGWQWLTEGWGKLTGSDSWLSHADGLRGFIASADSTYAHRAQAFGHPEVAYGWYVDYLNAVSAHALVFSRVVTLSELAVGIGLLLGCLTGAAAAGGVALNLMYITGGSAGTNGVFILLGVLLVAAWRVAGYLGADYFLLPRPRLPWPRAWHPRRLRGLALRGRRPGPGLTLRACHAPRMTPATPPRNACSAPSSAGR